MPDYPVPDKPVDVKPAEPVADTPEARLLKEIREDYRHFKDYWRENREEMEADMRFAGGDAFSSDERAFRESLSRPCETPDELSQYVKQTNNNLRQNKRDCKISPASEDANGDDAEKREAVLRGLNHRGNFQACFQTAYEQCTWSGFGFLGISIRKTMEGHLEPRPRRLANQFTVLLDPYAKEADYSDQKKCFVLDVMRKADFGHEYPNAQKKSFDADDAKIASDWILGDEIIVAEAWRVEDGKVFQYITNGLEIIEKIPWVGSWIPIIPILGEEIYVTEGGRTKRKYLSLIRRARTPQKMLAFIASQELEEFGMAPRAPFIGYKGQFTSPDWPTINTNPKPFIEVEALPDPLDAQKVLPLPSRPQYVPNAQAYEVAREAWRRGVQAAMGITPLPSAAQRQNEKSGIALEKIQNQEAVGSYHFTDNADRALVNYGRQMNELIDKGMSHGRHVGVRKQDDTQGLLYLAKDGEKTPPEMAPEDVLVVGRGSYDLAITTGPSKESEREDAQSVFDTIIQNLQALPVPQPIGQKILSLALRLKNAGPLVDQMAKLLDPEEGTAEEKAQKLMQQAQQQQQLMQELQAELSKLQLEKQGKVLELQAKHEIEKMNFELQKIKIDASIAIAEIQTKAQIASEREAELAQTNRELHQAAHETALSAQEHGQTLEQSAQTAALQPPPEPAQPQV